MSPFFLLLSILVLYARLDGDRECLSVSVDGWARTKEIKNVEIKFNKKKIVDCTF